MQNFINIARKNYKQACSDSNVTDFWTLYCCRVFASIFVVIIRKTGITPNQLTYFSLVIHVIGILFLIKIRKSFAKGELDSSID